MAEICEIPHEEHAENQRAELSILLRHYNEVRTQLADRDAEIRELRCLLSVAESGRKAERNLRLHAEEECGGTMVSEIQNAAKDAAKVLADRDAEIERLRADLVWSVRKGVMVSHDENLRPCVWFDVHRGVECDGTHDSICRAVREARDVLP